MMVRTSDVQKSEPTSSQAASHNPTTQPRNNSTSSQGNAEFTFFNISHPSEVRSSQRRKQVRSHVTQEQHRRRRMPNANKRSHPHAVKVPLLSQTHETITSFTSPMPLQHAEHRRGSAARQSRAATSPASTGSSTDSLESNLDAETRQRLEMLQATTPPYAVPHPNSRTIVRNDPFTCYEIPWLPWYDKLLHHMMTVFAPRGWPSLKITNKQGQEWEQFMTHNALAEPALLYVRLLFASGDLVKLGVLKRERTYSLHLHAIKAINEALSDSNRCVSDGLILAVGRIALHEFMYGDRAAANQVHRPAQRRMIDLRGGMTGLEFPNLVKKLMRWADNVMSIQGNTNRLLPDEEELNNETYGMQQSLNVLEAWAPETGQAVRSSVDAATLRRG